ncbi:hypothetical protein [Demequina sp.]|uniref:hypothetical protein n=1 Tax=Demequina sp. TaxID=2050685 RepID=UPI003D0ED387
MNDLPQQLDQATEATIDAIRKEWTVALALTLAEAHKACPTLTRLYLEPSDQGEHLAYAGAACNHNDNDDCPLQRFEFDEFTDHMDLNHLAWAIATLGVQAHVHTARWSSDYADLPALTARLTNWQ